MFDAFKKDIEQRKQNFLYRKALSPEGLDFSSNDYLGLSQHPKIKKALTKSLKREDFALSSKASRLLGGTSPYHIQAEKELAKFIRRPSALSFASGYQANVGLIPALSKERVIFSDQLNHASLIDGIRLSRRPYHIFRHNNLNHLEDLLKAEKGGKLILTESLFSMEGDFSPLKELSRLATAHQALLLVDEAHSTGLFGKHLGGFVSDLKQKEHIITVHTGGKALGSSGAFVGSSLLIKKYLINHSRSFIYSTAPPPLLMAQWLSVLQVLKKEKHRSLKLRQKALQFRKDLGLPLSESPILFIVLKSSEEALKVSQKLKEEGFFIPAIREPTAPKGRPGLRLSLHFQHTKKQLDLLKQSLTPLIQKARFEGERAPLC